MYVYVCRTTALFGNADWDVLVQSTNAFLASRQRDLHQRSGEFDGDVSYT